MHIKLCRNFFTSTKTLTRRLNNKQDQTNKTKYEAMDILFAEQKVIYKFCISYTLLYIYTRLTDFKET